MIYVQTKQSIFPKAIYIGDRAELRLSFTSESLLTAGPVSTEAFTQALDLSLYEIKEMSLEAGQNNSYTLVISFIPWRTGSIKLPDYELQGLGTIKFEAIEILSLVEQQNISSLRAYSSPLLLPGTAYKIYGSIAAFVLLLVVIIRLIVKWHSVIFWFNNTKLRRKYSRSKKNTIKELKKLAAQAAVESAGEDAAARDSVISTKLQKIMRQYLELRLNAPFTKKLTSELTLAFEEASCGLADDTKYEAFEDIVAAFVRTDFIRFSDSPAASFEEGEVERLIKNLINDIELIDGEGGKNA